MSGASLARDSSGDAGCPLVGSRAVRRYRPGGSLRTRSSAGLYCTDVDRVAWLPAGNLGQHESPAIEQVGRSLLVGSFGDA